MDESKVKQIRRPARIIGLAIITTVGVVAAAASLVYATEIFLVLFLAILFGVFLSRVSDWTTVKTPLPYCWSLGVVTSTLIAMFVGGAFLFGIQVDDQIAKARTHVDEAETMINDLATKHPSLRSIIASTPFLHEVLKEQTSNRGLDTRVPEGFLFGSSNDRAGNAAIDSPNARSTLPSNSTAERFDDSKKNERLSTEDSENKREDKADSEKAMASVEQDAIKASTQKAASVIGGVFKTTFGLLVNSALIFFVGLFIAIAPGNYRDGIVSLCPLDRRARTTEIMNMMGDSMWHWLIGRFGSMLITGMGAAILLAVLGVPMAISIGVVTALLAFIPNIGGIIALTLAVLFALPQGGTTVGLVVGGFTLLQLIESYIATPLIQQKQVSIPPALLIAFQAILGVLFGFLGAAVASPMLAAVKVGVEEAYIKDVLESDSSEHNTEEEPEAKVSFPNEEEDDQPTARERQEPTWMA